MIDFIKGEHKTPEYLAINPGGKVPAVKIDDLLMTESGAITTYLCDLHPDSGFIPAVGTADRARYEQWSYFALCELEQGLWSIGKHRFALPESQRVSEVIKTAEWEFQQAAVLLSEGLGDKQYILGDSFSGADILLAHTLLWAVAFKQPLEHKNLQAYLERCTERPAFVRAKEKEAIN